MAPRAQRRPSGREERGAALLVVMVAVALLTAAAVDLAYQARVNLQIAANARDELQAEAQARGALALARLVLHFQAQIDDAAGTVRSAPGIPAAAGLAGGMPRPQLWKLVPVDGFLTANLFPDAEPLPGAGAQPAPGPRPIPGAPAGATAGAAATGSSGTTAGAGAAAAARAAGATPGAEAAGGLRPTGAGPGTFRAQIEDEDRKVNVQLDTLATSGQQGAQLDAFLAMVADKKWDFLFDRDDADGQRTSRTDLAVHLLDWTDPDQVQAAVTGNPARPFESGFGDENYAYDRKADRYKAKNARFDSLAELQLVTGVSDAFMAAFGDQLTVYLGKDAKMNVNTDDREGLLRNARMMADPPGQAILLDPAFPDRLAKAVREIRMGGLIPMSPTVFAQALGSLGLTVRAAYTQAAGSDGRGAFTDRSRVFHVRATGQAGGVQKTIDAVVTFDPAQARDQAAQLGRLLHWHQE